MRKVPTIDDRLMHRARISSDDMHQAVAFIEAALRLEAQGKDSRSDVTHLALTVAAVIYYARPFTRNERRPKKGSQAKGAPPLSRVDLAPLSKVLGSKEARMLHRSVIRLRNKVVAHAESRYFPVRLVAAFLPRESIPMGDFAIRSAQVFPVLDLPRLRSNANHLGAAFGLRGHFAAFEVRRTRKRLHKK